MLWMDEIREGSAPHERETKPDEIHHRDSSVRDTSRFDHPCYRTRATGVVAAFPDSSDERETRLPILRSRKESSTTHPPTVSTSPVPWMEPRKSTVAPVFAFLLR